MQTDFNKLLNLVEKQKSAMLTTKQNDGLLKSRPMWINQLDQDGTVWFFNNENSCKANEIKEHSQVNLSFKNEKEQKYVSISGKAEIVTDRAIMEKLMTTMVKAWFPEGLDDPNISLIKVNFEKGAYWVTEESKLSQAFEITKALLTKQKADLGNHATVE